MMKPLTIDTSTINHRQPQTAVVASSPWGLAYR